MTTTLSCLFTPPVFSPLLAAPLVTPRSTDLLFTGLFFLIATIVGFETRPRVGKAIYGGDLLTPPGIRDLSWAVPLLPLQHPTFPILPHPRPIQQSELPVRKLVV